MTPSAPGSLRASPARALARVLAAALAVAPLLISARSPANDLPAPGAVFGFQPGSDRQLIPMEQIEEYFERIAKVSDRVQVLEIGPTTEGHRTIAALVSAPENLAHLDAIRAVNQQLADPRSLPPREARRLAAGHKVVVAIGAGIHASEIGGTQAMPELLHQLAASSDRETLAVLRDVVLILIPSLNPDGYRAVVDWYRRTRDTPFEGAPLPGLSHKYAGRDINRDGFMMNLAESRNLARFFYRAWHPHVFLSLHQMGPNGPRMFVPPVTDPIDRNYDPLIWREAALLGGAMALELQRDGRRGVFSNGVYDYYWPGYEDSAPLGHNTVCLLAEVAGARLATPITVAPGELSPQAPGAAAGVNAPDPWPGGPWTLRDIVDYNLSAIRGLLHAVGAYRERIVEGFYEMGARAVDAGTRGEPFAFVVPSAQHDPHAAARLEQLLLDGAVEIHRALEPFRAGGDVFPAGSDLILLAQPYRAYVKTLLERQEYPTSGGSSRPYDAAGWTLPAQMGVDVRTIDRPFELPAMSRVETPAIAAGHLSGNERPSHYVIDAPGTAGALAINRLLDAGAAVSWTLGPVEVEGSTYAPGSLVVPRAASIDPLVTSLAQDLGLRATAARRAPSVALAAVGRPRLGLYQSWMDNPDDGWTRWVLDRYGFQYTVLSDAAIRAGDLRSRYDAIVVPSAPPAQLLSGHAPGSEPPEFVGGWSETGAAAIDAFVRAGGTLVCLDQSCALAAARLAPSLHDVAHGAAPDAFFCPGSILALDVDPSEPLAFGMSPRAAGFFADSAAYDASAAPGAHVAARYASRDLLVSGALEGGHLIAGRAAALTVPVGAGRVVVLGFPVQHRGQSLATFRLLFNAIFTTPARQS